MLIRLLMAWVLLINWQYKYHFNQGDYFWLSLSLMDPLWDLTRAVAVSLLLKGCHYHAILISTGKDHGSCMSSGYSPSLWLIVMNHYGTCTGISVLWFHQVWLALKASGGTWETYTWRNGPLSRKEESRPQSQASLCFRSWLCHYWMHGSGQVA